MIWGALWFVASSALTAYACVVAHRRGREGERAAWLRACRDVADRATPLEAEREAAALWAVLAAAEVVTGWRSPQLLGLTERAFGKRGGES